MAHSLKTPLAVATGIGVIGSAALGFGPLHQTGNGSFLGGVLLATAAGAAVLGVQHLVQSMRDN